jgi:hypothetical protein
MPFLITNRDWPSLGQLACALNKYWKVVLSESLTTIVPSVGSKTDRIRQFLSQPGLDVAWILGILDGIRKVVRIEIQIDEVFPRKRAGVSEGPEKLRGALSHHPRTYGRPENKPKRE